MNGDVSICQSLSSRALRGISHDLGTVVYDALPSDWLYIDSLRKREGDALGFIPQQQYISILQKQPRLHGGSLTHYYRSECIFVCMDNDDLTGFCYVGFGSGRYANIYQVVVQEDARRWQRASLLLEALETEALERALPAAKARVAVDIEANAFWTAAGYGVVNTVSSTFLARTASKSGRILHVYFKHLANAAQPSLLDYKEGSEDVEKVDGHPVDAATAFYASRRGAVVEER